MTVGVLQESAVGEHRVALDPGSVKLLIAAGRAVLVEAGAGAAASYPDNLYASAGLIRPRGTSETLDTKCGIYVISPQGKLLKFIPIPEDTITNNTFGGPDMKTLYITAGKTLYKVRTEIPGLPR